MSSGRYGRHGMSVCARPCTETTDTNQRASQSALARGNTAALNMVGGATQMPLHQTRQGVELRFHYVDMRA